MPGAFAVLALGAAVACAQSGPPAAADSVALPAPRRPVAAVVSPSWDDESRRDGVGEADRVFQLLSLGPGTRVADIGAGSGYYTLRLARRLGPRATIYAEDIDSGVVARLGARLAREQVRGVRLVLGDPADPRLPAGTVDLALLSHMYHEIARPYDFLYNLHRALAPGARVAIIDSDRPTGSHGTPPALLRCELGAVGYRETAFHRLAPADGYLAVFAAPQTLPPIDSIAACQA
ncbi:MAG TPA: class I SAM-dependent methyltransferase [Gemmatimonadales bacterium]|nr:class I SAM-dependent methyltransferase [Gemmatimonadales bacterium]